MSKKLFVGGLAWATTDERLKEVFAPHGNVVEAKVVYDRETGRSRGFGFVGFSEESEAQAAMAAMQGQNVDGRALRIDSAEDNPAPRGERSGTDFRSRGGDRPARPNTGASSGGEYRPNNAGGDNRRSYNQPNTTPPPFPQDSDFGFAKDEGLRGGGREQRRSNKKKGRDRYKGDDNW